MIKPWKKHKKNQRKNTYHLLICSRQCHISYLYNGNFEISVKFFVRKVEQCRDKFCSVCETNLWLYTNEPNIEPVHVDKIGSWNPAHGIQQNEQTTNMITSFLVPKKQSKRKFLIFKNRWCPFLVVYSWCCPSMSWRKNGLVHTAHFLNFRKLF